MRKILILVAIIVTASLLAALSACNAYNEQTLEDNVRAYLQAPDAELVLVGRDNPEWLDYTCSQYVAKIDGMWYRVGVQHNGNSVHYVDVEERL